jgi:hypothetical protein
MYSAVTAQSTMDFSIMPVDDGVVDSPPNGRKCPHLVCSPSPLKCQRRLPTLDDQIVVNVVTQRKLYCEGEAVMPIVKVQNFKPLLSIAFVCYMNKYCFDSK